MQLRTLKNCSDHQGLKGRCGWSSVTSLGTAQVTPGPGRHGHTTCHPQQPDCNQNKSQLPRGRVSFPEAGGLFAGRDHA